MRPVILLAESDEPFRERLRMLLADRGYEVIVAIDGDSLKSAIKTAAIDLAIVGSWNGATASLELVQCIRRLERKLTLVMVVADSTEELAIGALRAGVVDYIRRPCSDGELLTRVASGLSDSRSESRKESCTARYANSDAFVGESLTALTIKATLAKVAASDSNVLITGETGTGKELAAELIHKQSSRAQRPFECVNCAALPESLVESELFGYERGAFTGAVETHKGRFELANGGTIFLDEIGDMSPWAQAKILRTIETGQVHRLGSRQGISLNVRIIAATNQDAEQLVGTEGFRKDLYFRLNVVRIDLPPLRDRKEDIPSLLSHFVRRFSRSFGRSVEGFDRETMTRLCHYDWPGNVRELKNLCEAIFINQPSRLITMADLPEPYQNRFNNINNAAGCERDQLLAALFETNWNVSMAARKLHWSRMTVYRKLAKYHINKSNENLASLALPDSF